MTPRSPSQPRKQNNNCSVSENSFKWSLCFSVFLSVDGLWGSWSPFTPCPVTCGVGPQVSVRRCDSPAPNHGGKPCPGEGRRISICTTNVHCPGTWTEEFYLYYFFHLYCKWSHFRKYPDPFIFYTQMDISQYIYIFRNYIIEQFNEDFTFLYNFQMFFRDIDVFTFYKYLLILSEYCYWLF